MDIDKTLKRLCRQFRNRLRRLLLEYGILRTVFITLILSGVAILLDWHLRLSADTRMLLLAAIAAVTALSYYLDVHRPLRRLWNDDEILTYLDTLREEKDDLLVTLRDLSSPEGMRELDTEEGRQIVAKVVEDLSRKIDKISIRDVVRPTPVRRWRTLAAAVLGIYVMFSFFPRDPQTGFPYLFIGLGRLLIPYADFYWPQKTRILVQKPESGWTVPKGEPLTIKAKIDGEVPPVVEIVYRTAEGGSWIRDRMAVDPKNAEATYTFNEVTEPMKFYCIGGDDYNKIAYRIEVAERPVVTAIKAIYEFPKYTLLPKKIVNSGQISGIEGTQVKVEVTASSPLSKALVSFDYGTEKPETIELTEKDIDGNTFSFGFRLKKSGYYTIEMVGANHLKNGRPERYEIRVEPDNPPEVVLEEPSEDVTITVHGKVHVKFKAKDDYNITKLEVMLAEKGNKGKPLSDRITGPFWDVTTTLHPVGEGDFVLDFAREAERGTLKDWNIQPDTDLELWLRAVDCKPENPGITESPRVTISLLPITDFMETVMLEAKDLMNDARIGWYAAAGVYYDGKKWLAKPNDDLLAQVKDQKNTLVNSTKAVKSRFEKIVKNMKDNRLYRLFMSRRLDAIGNAIAEMEKAAENIEEKFRKAKPSTLEEAQPERRRQKMAAALKGMLKDLNEAAWRMRLLYNHIADWVALQSVLIKTRRMEELQRETNALTEKLVKMTLGKEAIELGDEEVRFLKDVASKQETVRQMDEALEKELAQLILAADREGRKKVWQALARAFHDLRENRIATRLKRAALAINDARAEVVKKDQELALQTLETVNRGLIKAGEEVPPPPPASLLASPIEDPRGKKEATARVEEGKGEAIEADAYRQIENLTILREAKKDTLEGTLQSIFDAQEDVRNRTMYIASRGKVSRRYLLLRSGLTAHRQGKVVNLLRKALTQAKVYKPEDKELQDDPRLPEAQKRITSALDAILACADTARAATGRGDFGNATVALQEHVRQTARELRVYIQERERVYRLYVSRKKSEFKDSFGRLYLLNGKNLHIATDAYRDIQWAWVINNMCAREAKALSLLKNDTRFRKQLAETVLRHVKHLATMVETAKKALQERITDPEDKERSNERVKPTIQEKVLSELDGEQVDKAVQAVQDGKYDQAALLLQSYRARLANSLLAMKDIFEMPVPPKKVVDYLATAKVGEVVAGPGGFIEYKDETPQALAKRLEEEGKWIDQAAGPEVRKMLIERLKSLKGFSPKYARLQSAYFQALAQHFQAKAKNRLKTEGGKR